MSVNAAAISALDPFPILTAVNERPAAMPSYSSSSSRYDRWRQRTRRVDASTGCGAAGAYAAISQLCAPGYVGPPPLLAGRPPSAPLEPAALEPAALER